MVFQAPMQETNKDLLKSAYEFDLPEHLIAQRPVAGRENSRLLVYKVKSNKIIHSHFHKLPEFLPKNSLLTMNQSKVFPCRLIGKKATGGKVEVFVLSLLHDNGIYPAMIKTSGKKVIGEKFLFGNSVFELTVDLIDRNDDGTFFIKFNLDHKSLLKFLEEEGKIPIPPYIRSGESDEKDYEDYQTVYAKEVGSVAAPTAGLHFTENVFKQLEKKNIEKSFVTLHVGAGTFLPVKTKSILDHHMHTEFYEVDRDNLAKLNSGKKVFAVGTTSLRVIESIYNNSNNKFETDHDLHGTNIFLYPGKEVKSISGLLTNFHLPGSTLLMLISSLMGRDKALEIYSEAIKNEYRFFSYGDAMLILREE
jgi:S-adenosylmethionine:tRNA ribosyltransferase-isomerase